MKTSRESSLSAGMWAENLIHTNGAAAQSPRFGRTGDAFEQHLSVLQACANRPRDPTRMKTTHAYLKVL